jgi:carbon storage regulator CsrA
MLSLIRRPTETIQILTSDGMIELTISDIQHNQARIQIEAPRSIKILRSEIDLAPTTSRLRFFSFSSNK